MFKYDIKVLVFCAMCYLGIMMVTLAFLNMLELITYIEYLIMLIPIFISYTIIFFIIISFD